MADTPKQSIEEKTIKTQVVEEPVKRYTWQIIGGIVLLVIIGVAIFYLVKKHKSSQTSNSNPIDQIREAFPITTSTPAVTANTATSTPPASTSSTASIPLPPEITNHSTHTNPPATPITPAALEYQNSALGFSFTLPGTWAVDASRSNANSIAFINNTLRQQGFVEVYDNPSGETLDSLSSELADSPSVISVSRTTVGGQSAVYFKGATPQQNGVAIIAGGRIYYLRGDLANPSTTASFHLL